MYHISPHGQKRVSDNVLSLYQGFSSHLIPDQQIVSIHILLPGSPATSHSMTLTECECPVFLLGTLTTSHWLQNSKWMTLFLLCQQSHLISSHDQQVVSYSAIFLLCSLTAWICIPFHHQQEVSESALCSVRQPHHMSNSMWVTVPLFLLGSIILSHPMIPSKWVTVPFFCQTVRPHLEQ